MKFNRDNIRTVAFALMVIGTTGIIIGEFLADWGTIVALSLAFINVVGLSILAYTGLKKPEESGPTKKTDAPESPEPAESKEQTSNAVLAIPHPEEPPDYSKTLDNTTTERLLSAWFDEWKVPLQYHDWWRREMNITISLNNSSPAAASSETRQVWIRPEWANPGVIAHELAHVSYSLLTRDMKSAFSRTYSPLKTTDPLITLLYSRNTYGLTNDIEGHAEVYRYLGEQMPEQLKQFYPNLF